MYYTYLLESARNGGWYAGGTKDLKVRVEDHFQGSRSRRHWLIDSEALAAQVRRVATDDLLRSKLSGAGPRRVATCFHWNEHVGRILESFRRALAESRAGAPKPSSGTPVGREL